MKTHTNFYNYFVDVIDTQADRIRVERLLATWLIFIYRIRKLFLRIGLRLLRIAYMHIKYCETKRKAQTLTAN